MCGIAAIYAYSNRSSHVDRTELHTIRDHMAVRGPDGRGEWYSQSDRVGLAHRRLAIIDPDERAAQPMLSQDGKLAIVFNGEIYNFRELRAGLEREGHRFHTESDTEVLLALYAEKREAMLRELRGMFAFIIWDTVRNSMFMARDPYGIKPLYYVDDGRTLRAASQVKALLAGGGVSTEPEPAGIVGFYLFGSVPEPYTMYKQIRQLQAGQYLQVDERGAGEPQTYFSIASTYSDAESSAATPTAAAKNEIQAALLDSVRHHLVADVPVGAFLSAGIDSSSLVGLMRDAGVNDIQTVTLAFDEFEGSDKDEAPLAEQVAQLYHTNHITRRVGREEFENDLPKILDSMDQPSIDGINTWFVSKAAAEQGLKVAVSGLGGDELFGGYPSFQDIPKWVNWFGVPSRIPLLGSVFRKMAAPFIRQSGISPKSAGMLELGGHWEGAWFLRRGLFMPWELGGVMDTEVVSEGLRKLRPLDYVLNAMKPAPKTPFARVACMESALYMRNQLLRDSDWAGMAHSLEIRVPLVDSVLLEKSASIACGPGSQWNKSLLSTAPIKALPASITNRAKSGFETPIGRWMNDANSLQGSLTGTDSRRTMHWSRKWATSVAGAQALH